MNWIYCKLLWFLGFKLPEDPPVESEKITFMLRRQKQRLGIWWWLMVGGTFVFLIWLFLHVLGVSGL